MKYIAIILSLLVGSCIKINTSDINIRTLDQAVLEKLDARQSAGFWEAMQQSDFRYAEQFADSSEEGQFSGALQDMLAGDYESAVVILEHLVDSSEDTSMVKHSGTLLVGLYTLSFNWDALIDLDGRLPGGIDDMNTISMVRAWNLQQPEVIHYPDAAFTVPMETSISGVPMIKVLVNGVEQTFWIDTGAEFTVLASDIAEKCMVQPIAEEATQVGTSTDKKIELWPGAIDELKIENLVFENHPVFIISKADLEFRLFKIFKILKIDGILGWNAIQNLKLDLDYGNLTVTFEKPSKNPDKTRNFHFLTQPFVSVSDTTGVPLKFFLDTGANVSSLYEPAYTYFDTSKAETSKAAVGGAGGFQTVEQFKFENQSLILGTSRIDFSTITGKSPMGDTEEGFILYDGILGSDIAKDARLTLDFQNGHCELNTKQVDG